ncbi:hypothetical protein ACJJTC_010034 [Scirpophaga incertulas]
MNEVSGRRTAGSRSLAARCAGNTRLPQKACFIYLPKQVSGKNPQTYIDIMGSNATIRRLVTEVPIFDWKTACKDVLKTTQTLHFQISKTKRIILNRTDHRKILVRGEISIITASPYKTELGEKQNTKNPNPNLTKKMKKKTIKRTRKPKKSEESQTSEEEEDTECLYCCGLYSESTEEWITCHTCGKWAHCGCAGVDDSDYEAEHICTVCEDDGA